MNPFDIINDLSYNKKNLLENEGDYLPFIANKHFSYFSDTIFYSNELNMNSHLDKQLQHDYYFNIIRKCKRYAKWNKKDKSTALDAVQRYYQYSESKAKEVLKLLNKKQIQYIMHIMSSND